MSHDKTRVPILNLYFVKFLDENDLDKYVERVVKRYQVASLERLVFARDIVTRRAAVLALGRTADFRSNAAIGHALLDVDRGVRMIAETAIREIWRRDGTDEQQMRLNRILDMNAERQFEPALTAANQLIEEAPFFAEAWNQRAISLYNMDRFQESIHNCHQALEINPYHFPAAVGMAHCYLEISDGFAALECFRRALRVHPHMEDVRAQVDYLERMLEGK